MNQSPIFLYGPSGSGKSTVGRILAESLNLPFTDLDANIETQAGVSILEIFATEGEVGFRDRERAALLDVLAVGERVVSLGGGALLDPENRAASEACGQVLCLVASPKTLFSRLRTDSPQRPLLASDAEARLRALLARRANHYASFPQRLDTENLTPEAVTWKIQVLLGMFHVRGMGSATAPEHQGYDVWVQARGLDLVGDALRARGLDGPIGLVSDEHVGNMYTQKVTASLEGASFQVQPVTIPPGEAHKTVETVKCIWDGFSEGGLERGSTVVALGGGVVVDLAGFAAATYMRGVVWVALPTSLLAMVDASLGGKTGADLPQGKNLVGAFHAPWLVLADPQTLKTLPEKELRSGLAEVVKHGVIGDPDLFALCAQGWDAIVNWDALVRRAMAVKIKIIQTDPFESGRRAALNLGHTIGHGVELASGYRLRHGEAIAIGMVAEARLAERLGLAEAGLAKGIAACLRGLGLPTEIPPDLDRQTTLRAMSVDKKKSKGQVRFSLPVRIGEVQVGVEVGDWRLEIRD